MTWLLLFSVGKKHGFNSSAASSSRVDSIYRFSSQSEACIQRRPLSEKIRYFQSYDTVLSKTI